MAAAASTTETTKVSNTSQSSHIHDDIAFSILSKLPIKSLTRFTCAKKSWSLLFQNPNFMNMFRTNFFIPKHHDDDNVETRLLLKKKSSGFPSQESLYILSGEKFEKRVSLDWPPPFQVDDDIHIPFRIPFPLSIHILGSASLNGTLCLYRGLDTLWKIVLWNPSSAEFTVLPPSIQPHGNIEINLPPYGFGYDRVKDDFKVIRVVHYPLGFEVEPFWEIYSLKSNSWRKLNGVDDMPVFYPSFMSHISMNGFCHWLMAEGDNIVSFDFISETFIATPLPSNSDIEYELMKMELVELNGSLSYITCYDKIPYFHIWVLGELGVKESWFKFFVVGPLTCPLISGSGISVGKKNRVFFKEEDFELGWLDLSTQRIERMEAKDESFSSHIVIYKE